MTGNSEYDNHDGGMRERAPGGGQGAQSLGGYASGNKPKDVAFQETTHGERRSTDKAEIDGSTAHSLTQPHTS